MDTTPTPVPSIYAGDRVRVSHRKFGYPVTFDATVAEAYPSDLAEGHWYLVVGAHRDSAGLARLEAVVETHAQRVEVL